MLDAALRIFGIAIICALAIGIIALLIFTTSRLKWIVVGCLWSAAITNFGHWEGTSTVAGLILVGVFAWDEHLRVKKVDAVIADKLAGLRLTQRKGISQSEIERFAIELKQELPRCLSLLSGGRSYRGEEWD